MTGIHSHHATRGYGLLEVFLAKKRAKKANNLIDSKKRTGKILDIGCGTFPYFLDSVEFAEKHGVDGAIKSTKAIQNIKIHNLDFEKKALPFSNNYFDVVAMLAVFEHIHESRMPELLSEINRILKKDGQLVMTTPSPVSPPILVLLARTKMLSSIEISDHKHSMPKKKIEKYLKKADFKNVKSGYFELFCNMWFVAKK